MSRISQRSAVAPLNLFSQATSVSTGTGYVDPSFSSYVGQRFDLADGREVTLVQNGAVALAAGVLVQSEAEVTAHEKLAMTVPAAYPATAGLNQILVTNGSTVLNQNKFAGGFVVVAAGTGIGQYLRINSHAAAANAGTFVVSLMDAIVTTLDATSKISLVQNPYKNVIINPTTATGAPVGVSLYPLAASTAPTYDGTSGALTAAGVQQYGLIQTRGIVSVLVDNTVTNVGYPVGRSAATAGTVGVATLTTVGQIGIAAQTLTSAQNGVIYLAL